MAAVAGAHTGIGHTRSFTDLPGGLRPRLGLPDVGVLAELLRGRGGRVQR